MHHSMKRHTVNLDDREADTIETLAFLNKRSISEEIAEAVTTHNQSGRQKFKRLAAVMNDRKSNSKD